MAYQYRPNRPTIVGTTTSKSGRISRRARRRGYGGGSGRPSASSCTGALPLAPKVAVEAAVTVQAQQVALDQPQRLEQLLALAFVQAIQRLATQVGGQDPERAHQILHVARQIDALGAPVADVGAPLQPALVREPVEQPA